MTGRTAAAIVTLVLGAVGAGCAGDPPAADPDRIVLSPAADGEGHTHAPGQGHSAQGPVGDGTSAAAGGYRMTSVRLPPAGAAGGPGEVSFRIVGDDGRPVREYVEEQTRLLHLYVVRADLGEFRHLHPELGADGTWRARVDLDSPGDWRVVAELTPAGSTRPVVLGEQLAVPGESKPTPPPRGEGSDVGDDGVVRVEVAESPSVGGDGRMRLVVGSLDDQPVALGNYLGTSAHLTGFRIDGGELVHVHPYGAPEPGDDGTALTFHTTFTEPGDYRLFVQVRVDGLLHQVALTVPVS